MAPSPLHPSSAHRIVWALGVSVLAHAALVVLVQDQPGGASSLRGARLLDARIESMIEASTETLRPTAEPPATPGVVPSTIGLPMETRPESDAPSRRVDAARAIEPPRPASESPVEGMELPFVRDPTYYAMAALDTPPRLIGSAELCYPQGAVGEVAYLLSINESGAVDEAAVVNVEPRGLFVGAAAELCRRLKFAPATKDGRAVRSRVRLVVGQPVS